MPPSFWASAMICSVMVVLPDDSGPKISTTRPRGTPPTPSAASKEIEPVLIVEIGTIASLLPRRMIEPLPNCFSICESARSIARDFRQPRGTFSSAIHAPMDRPRRNLDVRTCRESGLYVFNFRRRRIIHPEPKR